jgi:amino acid permease
MTEKKSEKKSNVFVIVAVSIGLIVGSLFLDKAAALYGFIPYVLDAILFWTGFSVLGLLLLKCFVDYVEEWWKGRK